MRLLRFFGKCSPLVHWVVASICVANVQARYKELESLQPGQRKNLADFKKKVMPLLTHDWMKEDIYLIKILFFNRFNSGRAENHLKDMLKWRKDANVDEELRISPDGPSQNFADIQAEYPIYGDGYDKEGRPICETPLGSWDLRKGALSGKTKRLIDHFTNGKGRGQGQRAAGTGEECDAVGSIGKSGGFPGCLSSLSQLAVNNLSIHLEGVPIEVGMAAGIDKYFPNSPHGFWCPNTPDAFHTLLSIVRPLLSASTRNAIKTFTANEKEWKPFLQKRIDISQLPSWAGGPKQRQ